MEDSVFMHLDDDLPVARFIRENSRRQRMDFDVAPSPEDSMLFWGMRVSLAGDVPHDAWATFRILPTTSVSEPKGIKAAAPICRNARHYLPYCTNLNRQGWRPCLLQERIASCLSLADTSNFAIAGAEPLNGSRPKAIFRDEIFPA